MRRAKKHKNSSSARHYDQIRFRFHTAWAHRYRTELSNECLVLGVNRRSNLALTQFWCTWDSVSAEQSGLKEIELSTAVHLAFHELEPCDLALSLAVGPWQCDCGADGGFILGDSVGE